MATDIASLHALRGQGPSLPNLRLVLGLVRQHLLSSIYEPSAFSNILRATVQLWDGRPGHAEDGREPAVLQLLRVMQSVFTSVAQAIAELSASLRTPPSPTRSEQQRRCAAAFASLQVASRAMRSAQSTGSARGMQVAIACVEVSIVLGCGSLLLTFPPSSPVHDAVAEPLEATYQSCAARLHTTLSADADVAASACNGLLQSLLWTAAPSYPSLPFAHAHQTGCVLDAFLFHLQQSAPCQLRDAAPPPPLPAPVPVFQQHSSTVSSCLSACLARSAHAQDLHRHALAVLAHCAARSQQLRAPDTRAHAQAGLVPVLWQILHTAVQAADAYAPAGPALALLPPPPQPPLPPAAAGVPERDRGGYGAQRQDARTHARCEAGSEQPPAPGAQGGALAGGVTWLQACALSLVCALASVYDADSRHTVPQLALLLTSLLHTLQDLPLASLFLLTTASGLLSERSAAACCASRRDGPPTRLDTVPNPSRAGHSPRSLWEPILLSDQGDAQHAALLPARGPAAHGASLSGAALLGPFQHADAAVRAPCGGGQGPGGAAAHTAEYPAARPADSAAPQASFLVTLASACFPGVAALPPSQRALHCADLARSAPAPLFALLATAHDPARSAAQECLLCLLPLLSSTPGAAAPGAAAPDATAALCLGGVSAQLAAYPAVTAPGEVADMMRALCEHLASRPAVLLCCADDVQACAGALLTAKGCTHEDAFAAGADLLDVLLVVLLHGPVSLVPALLALIEGVWGMVPHERAAVLSGRIFDKLVMCQDHRKKRTCVQWYHHHLHKLSLAPL